MRILLYIIRRTYGFNRTYAELSISEIADGIGTSKDNISRTLKKLRKINVIDHRPNKGVTPQTVAINKNYDEWAVDNCAVLPLSKMTTVVRNDNSSVVKNDNSSVVKNDNSSVVNFDNPTYKEIKESDKERCKERKPHGRYENVFLSDDEIIELNKDYGEDNIKKYIQKVDSYVQSKGIKYADYDAVIRKWLEDDGVKKSDIEKYKFVINKF